MMALFTDEKIITKTNDKQIVLTNHRIWKEENETGKSSYQSIMLQHITSVENTSRGYIALLVLAGILVLFSLNSLKENDWKMALVAVLIALAMIFIYFYTKYSLMIVSSPSTKMKIRINRMRNQDVLNFIYKIEYAISRKSINSRHNEPGI